MLKQNLIETLIQKKQYAHPILQEWAKKEQKATGKSRSSIFTQIQKRLQYRKWVEKNHDEILAKQRARYYADHETTKAKKRIATNKYYKANKDKCNEQRKKWGRENGKRIYQQRLLREGKDVLEAKRLKDREFRKQIAYTDPKTGKTTTYKMLYYHRGQTKKNFNKIIFQLVKIYV
jgi:hypothetical protein